MGKFRVIAFMCLLSVIICMSIITNVIVESNIENKSEVSQKKGVQTSGFLGQILVGLNAEASTESERFSLLVLEAKEINSDVVGWINIEEFGISYPVLYSDDNKEYLRKNIEGNYDISGSIYLDANLPNIYSPIKLIHGHNMKNGTMFSELPMLFGYTSLDQAPLIYYYDELGLKVFKIFSIFSVNAEEESMIVSEFATLKEIEELKQGYYERSWVPISEMPEGLEMLLLNTCWYGKSGVERRLHCIVVACRIR